MKRLLAVLFAAALALPVAADTQVVCSISAQAATACSAISVSQASALDPCRCNPGGGAAPSSLLTGLVSVWPLSADGTDSVGSNDLTNNNSVTFVAKGVGAPANLPDTVANFVAASNQYFSVNSLSGTASYTYAAWFNNPGLPSNETLISHGGGAWNTNSTAEIYSATGNTIQTRAGDGTSGVVTQDATVTTNAWHLAVVWFDDTDKKLRIQIDDHTIGVSSALPGSVVTTASTLLIGDARSTTLNWNGQISQPMLWSRVLTSDERACLYAAGDAVQYPFTGVCN